MLFRLRFFSALREARLYYLNGGMAAFVDKALKEHKIVVFSKTYCPYCKMAKQVLTEEKVQFYTYELDERGDGSAIQDYLVTKSGVRTVPQVFAYQTYLGGGTDMKELQKQKKLIPRLKQLSEKS